MNIELLKESFLCKNVIIPNKLKKKIKCKETFRNNLIYGGSHLSGIIHTLIMAFAIYISIKCNKGPDIFGILGAIFWGPFYIIYKLYYDTTLCGILSRKKIYKNI